jgi:hypothetical protein
MRNGHRTAAAHRTKVAVKGISAHQSFDLCSGISICQTGYQVHMVAFMKANELNLSLQRRNISIYITTDRISSFQRNL